MTMLTKAEAKIQSDESRERICDIAREVTRRDTVTAEKSTFQFVAEQIAVIETAVLDAVKQAGYGIEISIQVPEALTETERGVAKTKIIDYIRQHGYNSSYQSGRFRQWKISVRWDGYENWV